MEGVEEVVKATHSEELSNISPITPQDELGAPIGKGKNRKVGEVLSRQ
jgi:hypothetical protein